MSRIAKALIPLLLLPVLAKAELKVATLHPLLSDLAKNVGGNHVTVLPLITPLAVTSTTLTSAGRVSVITTPSAVSDPVLATAIS